MTDDQLDTILEQFRDVLTAAELTLDFGALNDRFDANQLLADILDDVLGAGTYDLIPTAVLVADELDALAQETAS